MDATGLEQTGLGASGIVALLGTAEGGKPVTEITDLGDFIRLKRPSAVRTAFRSGDLLEGAAMLFDPSNDGEIQAGAQEVVTMKVNPATQSLATLDNAQGGAIDLTSEDYGAFTEQVNVTVAAGTTKGKILTIVFEGVTETVDDLGGDTMFSLAYDETTNTQGWDTMTAQINSGGQLQADGTRAEGGLAGDVTALLASGAARVVSANAGDTTQTITLYGLDTSGDPATETLNLNGTTPVNGTQVWGAGDLVGARVVGTTLGAITVSDQVVPTTVMTVALGTNKSKGVVHAIAMFVGGGKLTIVADAAETGVVIVQGTNLLGAATLEKMTLNGATPVVSTADWTKITNLIMGDVTAARTVTYSGTALSSTAAVHTTVQQLADYANARVESSDGFTLTLVTGLTSYLASNLDVSVSATNIDAPASGTFLADLYTMVEWINSNSSLVTAALASGVSGGAVSNTTTPVFLSGGIEGVALQSHWQTALDLLKQARINTIVPLTGDTAVHAVVDAHCAYMAGMGRSERDAIAGLQNTAKSGPPTKTEAKAQVVALNSRHIRATVQTVDRFNIAGVRTTFQPYFTACIAAGMQAGSPVGTSLTWKYANVLAFGQDSSWSPSEDSKEMIDAGMLFLENVDGSGRRWVRNITTHLSSNNLAFIEASVNEAANFAVFSFRNAMEYAVGRVNFSGTVNDAMGVAVQELGLLVDENILVQYRALTINRVADTLEISVEMSPGIPDNFVKTTVHLTLAS